MWNDLSILDKSRIMLLAVLSGITSLSKIQLLYDSSLSLLDNIVNTIPNNSTNTFNSGGGIHIKPENRGKFTALKERTGHSATWFKQHGTPALRKMATFALNSRKWKHDDGGYINRYDDGSLLKDNFITAASKILNPVGSKHDSFWHTVDVLGAPSHVTNAIRDIGNRIASYTAIIADATYNHYANNQNWVEALQEAETNPSTLASLFQVHPIENNENNYSLEELALMYELTRPRKGKKEGGINAQDYRQINSKKGEGNKYAAAITKDNFFDPNKIIEWSVGGMSGLTDESGLPISFDRFAYDIDDTYGVYGNPNTWDNLVKPLRFAVGIIGSKGYPNRKDSKTSIVTKVPVAALKAAYDKLNNQYGLGSLLANGTRAIKRFFGLEKDNIPIILETPTEEIVIEQQPNVELDYNELRNRQAYAESRYKSNAQSPAGAIGLFQIMPSVLDDYNKKNNTSYTTTDLKNDTVNTTIRDWLMEQLSKKPWVTKGEASDSIKFAKELAAYNFGSTNTVEALNKAKEEGVDIYNNWDWLEYLPKETLDYINFILRNQNNSILRNDTAYKAALALNKGTVDYLNSKSTGGPLYPFSFSKIPYIKTPIVRY